MAGLAVFGAGLALRVCEEAAGKKGKSAATSIRHGMADKTALAETFFLTVVQKPPGAASTIFDYSPRSSQRVFLLGSHRFSGLQACGYCLARLIRMTPRRWRLRCPARTKAENQAAKGSAGAL